MTENYAETELEAFVERLVNEGVSIEDIIAAMELKLYALKEEMEG